MNDETQFGKGAVRDDPDARDLIFEDRPVGASAPLTDAEWHAGFDIEKKLNFKLPIKNQFGSESCVGQAFSYYVAILNMLETGTYDEASAKAIYSQIFLAQGGANFRDAAKLIVDWGEVTEKIIRSYDSNNVTDEKFMRDKSWLTPEVSTLAKRLQAKEYRLIAGMTIDTFAQAIRDGNGMVAGVEGVNNGTWYSLEPQPPVDKSSWGHALFFGKFGIDEKGKYIATPNSWGDLKGWQKIRENYFVDKGRWIFCPWVLIDKLNNVKPTMSKIIKDANSSAVGIWTPAKNEAELIELVSENGLTIPTLANGKVDWPKVKLDGKVTLNK